MIIWKVIFENLKGNRQIEQNMTCEEGSEKDNKEYWEDYWQNFLKNMQGKGKGWDGYRAIKIERVEQ